MTSRIGQFMFLGLIGVCLVTSGLVAQTSEAPSSSALKTEPAQNVAGSVPGTPSRSLTLGPGDLIDVNVLGEPDLSGKFRVSGTGEIALSMGGAIKVEGLTVEEAAAAIEKRLLESNLLREPHVSVFVEEYASQGVTVLGEVKNPGVYPMFGKHGLFDALSMAGGLSQAASNEVTIVHRNDPDHPQIVTMKSSPQHLGDYDVEVMPGDKIIASSAGVVYALGEVGRPGGFVLARNEPSYTVTKVLSLAEGFTHTAKLKNAIVIRETDKGVVQYAYSIPKVLAGKEPDLKLQAGDIVYVPASTIKLLGYRALEAVFTTVTGLVTYGKI